LTAINAFVTNFEGTDEITMGAVEDIVSNLEISTANSYVKQTMSNEECGCNNKIIWSLDKSKAFFSDVEIVIMPAISDSTKGGYQKMSTQQQSYFAHLPIIACGERGSLFFFKAAQYPDFVTNNSTVHVEMPPRLISHFSKLMNYLYDKAFVMSSENIIYLQIFSRIFEMPQLEVFVNQFIAEDMKANNAGAYLMRITDLQQLDTNGNDQYSAAIKECQEILALNIEKWRKLVTNMHNLLLERYTGTVFMSLNIDKSLCIGIVKQRAKAMLLHYIILQ